MNVVRFVCKDRRKLRWSFADQFHVLAQAEMAKARIEQKIAVASPDMPHVAAEEGLDPGFVDQRHIIGHADGFIPNAGFYRRDAHHVISSA